MKINKGIKITKYLQNKKKSKRLTEYNKLCTFIKVIHTFINKEQRYSIENGIFVHFSSKRTT